MYCGTNDNNISCIAISSQLSGAHFWRDPNANCADLLEIVKEHNKEKKEFVWSLDTGKKTLLIINTIFVSIFLLSNKVSNFPIGNLTLFSLNRAYFHLQININYCQQSLPLIIQIINIIEPTFLCTIIIYERCQKAFAIFTVIKAKVVFFKFSYPFFLLTFNCGKFFQKSLKGCALCVCLWTFYVSTSVRRGLFGKGCSLRYLHRS